jgi:very-long-chain (3R)-3-hydroxyacyl-CoA dehydratase
VTEVIRYAFYATSKPFTPPAWLTWLRYTTFYLLYPIGGTRRPRSLCVCVCL